MNQGLNWLITLFSIVGIFLIITKTRDHEEPYSALKIIGYHLPGVFRFSFNNIHIPLGFIIFLLFFRRLENNQKSKHYAAYLGLLVFIISLGIPALVESYYGRTRYTETITPNIYEFDFQEHWEEVAKVLKLDENSLKNARVEDLCIDYEKDGELMRLRYGVTWIKKSQFHHASVDYDEGQKKYRIKVSMVEQWHQYDMLISAERLFGKLGQLNIKDLTPIVDCSYYGLIIKGWRNFAIKDGETFIIEGNEVLPFIEEFPAPLYWLEIFGMEQTGENSYDSTSSNYYLFDS